MKYKVILWDFDGTLAYTSKDVWNSLEYAASECGGKLPDDYIKDDSNLGKPMKEIFSNVYPFPGDSKYDLFEELVRIHYRQLSEYNDTYLYDGIYELLNSTKKHNVINYIITMKPHEALERILKKRGWENLFNGWLSPDSFSGAERSKSDLISHVIKETEYDKSKFIYIGDTWSDAIAAHENGIECIGVSYGDGDEVKLKEKQPKYFIDNVSQIKEIIEEGA